MKEKPMNLSPLTRYSTSLLLAFALSACSSTSTDDPVLNPTGGSPVDASGGADPGVPDLSSDSLANKYAAYFPIGTAIGQNHLDTVQEIIKAEFNHLTAENAMKAKPLQPTEGGWNFAEADAIADFARAQGMMMTGHTLLWHRDAPPWFFSDLTPGDAGDIETLKARLKTHIETVVDRYADVVDNWDVVNEAISDDGSKDYRDGDEGSDWYAAFGSADYVYWAFKYAQDALEAKQPGSSAGKLYYNDYNVNLKVDRIIALCDEVRAKGGQVDGIGLQAHVRVDWPSTTELGATIQKIVAAGYKVKISELDVTLYNDYPSGTLEAAPEIEFTAAVEQSQATRYAELFELFRTHKEDITSVTFWGVSDDATWLDNEPVPGRNNHPLLFNEAHMPKAALSAIKDF